MAVAATASVGATIAPITKQTGHESPPMDAWQTAATVSIVDEHEPDREQRERPHVRAQVAQRGEERRASRAAAAGSPTSTISGLSSTCGSPGHEAEPSPPSTSRIGYGMRSDRREHEQRRRGDQQRQQDERVVGGDGHAGIVEAAGRPAPEAVPGSSRREARL